MVPEIQFIDKFFDAASGDSLSILRLDLPDPISGGNKIYKMKYNLEEIAHLGLKRILTFGGAYSNHIAATATAGKKNGFETIGIIRGNELNENSNAVLKYASSCGMKLVFVSRADYRKRNETIFKNLLIEKYGPLYLLPEGGSNSLAVQGCKEIMSFETEKFDVIICPVGSGATLAGIIAAAKTHQHVIGIAVLKGKDYLEDEVNKLLEGESPVCKWEINHSFTFGGYGNSSHELIEFISEVKRTHQLPLDPVYSGKALFAAIRIGENPGFQDKKVLFIHTGGYAFS
ncbi:pyridoxal-phosphate dependent enzyme [soil metagenome]